MPQVHVFRIVATDKQVEESIAVVIKPDGCVGIDPTWQARLFTYAGEALAMVVVKEFRTPPLDKKEVLIAIIVIVAPDRAHGDTGAGLVDIGNSQLTCDILEGTVVHIPIEAISTSLGAVGDVDIRPAIPIEINDGCRGPH